MVNVIAERKAIYSFTFRRNPVICDSAFVCIDLDTHIYSFTGNCQGWIVNMSPDFSIQEHEYMTINVSINMSTGKADVYVVGRMLKMYLND